MKKIYPPLKAIGIVVLVVMMGLRSEGATRYSVQDGNWSSTSSWSNSSGGPGGYSVPVAGDIVIIERNDDITVNGTFACASVQLGSTTNNSRPGRLIFASGSQLTVSGSVSLGRTGSTSSYGTITMTNGGTLICQSIISRSTSDVFTEGTGTVKLTGTFSLGATDVGNELGSFNNLHITSGTVTYAKNITILSDLLISSGATLDLSAYTSNRSSSGGTLTVAGTLLLGGTTGGITGSNFPSNFTTHTMTSGTVNYDNTNGSQTIFATPAYNNLTLSNSSGTQTAGGNLSVNGTLTTTTGGTLNMVTNTLSVATASHSAILRTQNISNSPLPSGITWGGTVIYDASSVQTVASGSYANLTISGAGGATTNGDITVTGILNLSAANPTSKQGLLHTDAYTLNMGVSSTTTGQGDVTGIVKRTHTFANGVEYSFGSQYTSITFLGVSGGTKPDWLSCKIAIGDAPSWKSGAVKRTYTFAENILCSDEVVTNLHYLDSELNGNAETSLVLYDYHSGGTIHEHGKSNYDATNNWVGISGFLISYIAPTSALDNKIWAFGNALATRNTWLGVNTTWTDNSNWSASHYPTSTEAVLIPGGLSYYPLLTGAATALTLEIAAGASLTANAQTITIAGNTGAWINNGTFNAGTGTVVFSKADLTKVVSIAGTTNFYDLTISNNTTYVQPASNSIIRIGNSISNSGVFDCESTPNTIEYNGTDQIIVVPNGANSGYHNLILSNSGTKTVPTVVVGNDFTISGSATVLHTEDDILTIGGNFLHNSTGDFTFVGTVNVKGLNTQTIGGSSSQIKFTTLKINNATGVSLSKNIYTTNLILSSEIPSSIFSDNGFQITGPGSTVASTLNLPANSTLKLGSSNYTTTFPKFRANNLNISSLVIYESGIDQLVSTTPQYGNLSFSGNSTKTMATGILKISGNWLNESNADLSVYNTAVNLVGNYNGSGNLTQGEEGDITVAGDWANTGEFTPSFANVTLTGTNRQIVGNGNLTFNMLYISGNYTNNRSGNLTIASDLDGIGPLTQGINSQLYIGGSISSSLALDATSNIPNLVVYDMAGNQTLKSTNYHTLTLASSGIKTFAAGTTSISNDLTITGTASAKGIINFTIGGNLYIGPSASLYLTPTSSASSTLTVNGEITNDRGAAGLVIQSYQSKSGSLLTTTPSISATVERYIANDQKWHFISAPDSNQAIWPQFAPDPGAEMSWGAYNASAPYNWDFYYYNPNALTASELYWVNLRKDETGAYNNGIDMTPGSNAGYGSAPPSFVPGRGYLVAYNNNWNPATSSPTTHSFSGVLNYGNIDVPIYYNSGNTFNLVGNPYPCSINWMYDIGWTRTCLGSAADGNDFWIYNDANGNYGAFSSIAKEGTGGVSENIAPGQAFFVKATSAGTLTMTDGIKTHSTQAWLKNTDASNDIIRLNITCSANEYQDEMIVKFDPSVTVGGTDKFWSFYTEAPELYSVKDGKNYSIDRYNALADDMKVSIAAKTGVAATYTITASNIANFTLRDKVYLLDLKTGIKTNLKQTPSYSFNGTPDDDRNRFQLIFGISIGVDEETSSDITIYASDNTIYVRNDKASQPYTVVVSNMLGQVFTNTKFAGNTLNQITLNHTPGVYVVTVYSEGSLFSRKVVVK